MAMILDGFLSQFGESLGNLVKDEVVMLWGVKDGIKSLQMKLQKIENVLEDAERRRIDNENIKLWLKELRVVMYEADDVIDEWSFESMKQRKNLQQHSSSLGTLVRCCLPLTSPCHRLVFHLKVGHRIKNINVNLDGILKDKDQFNFAIGNGNAQKTSHRYNRATSPLAHNEVLGIQIGEDTRRLVELLVQNKEAERCITFGIVGMGGIGKTTLAQKIFTDEIIKSSFPVRVWVWVSQDINELGILKEIIRQVGGSYHPEATKAELDLKLCKLVEHKRLLLVLDDVWDAKVWKVMGALLNNCEFGSRVLVTSRDERVVRLMGAMDPHYLKRLPTEDGWLILHRKVFWSRDDEIKTKAESLKELGIQIVEKCGGHPLAIQVVGGILSMVDASEIKWKEVFDKLGRRTWSFSTFQGKEFSREGEIMNVLYLSYQDLSPPLKQCFLYFSLFPTRLYIGKPYICSLRISEGFIKAEGGLSLEEVAEGYYTELVMRNLVQLAPERYNDYCITMHDLLHSLAKLLTIEENYCGDFKDLNNLGCRRLSITDEALNVIPESLKQCKHLRVLILFMSNALAIRDVPKDLFINLRQLRILDLSNTKIIRLPKSIEKLIHLRFLNASETDLEQVPAVIGRLINLQFLLLAKCSKLYSLPRGLTHLHNLRTLNINHSSVDYLPKGMSELQNLCYLVDFVVGEEGNRGASNGSSSSSSLEELKNLNQMAHLSISKLERVQSSGEARAVALEEKLHLFSLMLRCTIHVNNDPEIFYQNQREKVERIEEVFDELCPPPNVSEITLEGFFGSKFPYWLGDSSDTHHLPNLTRLHLYSCVNWKQLPPLGQLPQLDYLHLEGALAIENIGPELLISQDGVVVTSYHGNAQPFPKLRILIINGMPNWREWSGVEAGALHHLQVLEISMCPKLRSLPDGLRHASSLMELNLMGLNCIVTIENLIYLKKLQIYECPGLKKIFNLPMLEDLSIKDCPSLKNVVNCLGALRHLELSLLQLQEEMLPQWFRHENLSALQKLELECGFQLLKNLLPKVAKGEEDEDGVEWFKIQHIPLVHAIDCEDGSDYYFSYTKDPFNFNTNLPR